MKLVANSVDLSVLCNMGGKALYVLHPWKHFMKLVTNTVNLSVLCNMGGN